MCHTVCMANIFCAVVSCNGWMFALTWNADIKHELRGLVQSENKMNAEATARKTTTSLQFMEHPMRNRAVAL